MKLKLNQNTIEILKNFAAICNNIQFKAGNVIKTKSPSNTVIGIANIDQKIPMDFAVYDLPKFLSVLTLYKDPELTFNERYVLIGEDNRSVKYQYSDPKTIIAVDYEKNPKLPPVLTKFSLTAEQLSRVLKAASILGSPNIIIEGKNGKISLLSQDVKNPASDIFEIEIGDTDKDFKVVYEVSVFKLLPEDYTVTVFDTSMTILECDKVTYYLAATISK